MDASYAYDYCRYIIKNRSLEHELSLLNSPHYTYWYAHDVIKGRWLEGEPSILKSARYSYYYSKFIIKNEWPEASDIIKTNRYFRYHNRRFIRRLARLSEKETLKKVISAISIDRDGYFDDVYDYENIDSMLANYKDSCNVAYLYALLGKEDRWIKGESAISKCATCSLSYALNVIKGRWIEGEKTIMSTRYTSAIYDREVLNRVYNKNRINKHVINKVA